MERWIRFALGDLRRNWKKVLVSASAFILGIALMAALLVLASGAAAVGLGKPETPQDESGATIVLNSRSYATLFEQIMDENELKEIGEMQGVGTITPYAYLPITYLTSDLSNPDIRTLRSLEMVLTDSVRSLAMAAGRAPAAQGEIVLSVHPDRLPPHLRGIKLGDVVRFHTADTFIGPGSLPATRSIDGREFTVTGFFEGGSEWGSEALAALAMREPEIPVNRIAVQFSRTQDARAAYHKLADRYRKMPLYIFSSALVMDERSAMKKRQWASFLLLVSAGATAIGSVTLVNSFLHLSLARRREIGIMRCVGASRRQILGLFLFEHLALVIVFFLIGLMSGVLLGGGINTLIFRRYSLVPSYGLYAMFPITWDVLAYPALVALTIGFVASMIPSIKVSRVAPVEVLRHEE